MGEMSDARAKALTDLFNNLKGESDPIKRAQLVVDVLADLPDFDMVLPYTDTEFDEFKEILDFDWTDLDPTNPDPTPPTPSTTRMTFDLEKAQAKVVKKALDATGEETQEAGLLVLCTAFLDE